MADQSSKDLPPELDLGSEDELGLYAPVVIKPKSVDSPPAAASSETTESKAGASPKFSSSYSPSSLRPKTGSTIPYRSPAATAETTRPVAPAASHAKTSTPKSTPSSTVTSTPTQETKSPPPSMPATYPSTISDFKKNAERQSKEQKAVGDVISWIAYGLVAAFLLVTLLAGFGVYTLLKMIQAQSVTVAQLESRYTTDINALKDSQQKLEQELQQTEALANRQQDQINHLSTKVDNNATALHSAEQEWERDLNLLKTHDLSDLKSRLHRVESRP